MKKGQDIAVTFPGFYLIHQNLPGKEVVRHSHREHLIFIPLQGEIHLLTDNCRLRCGPGRMIYLPPKTEHAFESSRHQGERLICMIDEKAWNAAKSSLITSLKSPGKIQGKSFGAVPRVLMTSQLCKEILFYLLLNKKTKLHKALILVFIQALSEALEVGATDLDEHIQHLEAKAQDLRLKRVVSYLQERFSENISMTEMARVAGLSTRTLNRLCLDELGTSPRQILIQYRIQKAKELLSLGEFSVTGTALEVGYNSLGQFISAFRQVTGQLPSEFLRYGQKQ